MLNLDTDAALEIARLRRLLALSRRLNSEQALDRLLDEVIDTAIELTAAERGFLLLRHADGSRSRSWSRATSRRAPSTTPAGTISRSIAERAARPRASR